MTEPIVSPPALRRPPEWSRRERPLWFTPGVTAALITAVLAVVLGRDNLLVGGLFGALTVLLLGLVLVFPLARPVRVEPGEEGLRFPFRRRSRSLTLTPTGIVLVRGTTQVVPWSQISDISAWSPNLGFTLWPIRQNLITLESDRPKVGKGVFRWLARGVGLTIRTVRLATEPVVVYHALLFYLQHPQDRGELAGAAGLERVRAGRLTAED